MSDLMLDVSQATELKLAFRRAGFTNKLIKRLCEKNGVLEGVKDVLLDRSRISPIPHIIDCSADPFVPKNWKVEEHRKSGNLIWDPGKISLYLSRYQKSDSAINGNKLRKELEGKPVLNACVLDYLLEYQELIPEEWKGKDIFFWGTIYRDSDGSLHVRSLNWLGKRWDWVSHWLGFVWDDNSPAAVSAGV